MSDDIKSNENNTAAGEKYVLTGLAIAIVILWAICWFLLRNDPNRGTFGDMFGSVNALFSGFAFLGVIYAILLQRQELKLQRQELALTRQELSKSAKALEKTHQINTLSVAIESLEKRISRISLSGPTAEVENRRIIKNALDRKLQSLIRQLDNIISELIVAEK